MLGTISSGADGPLDSDLAKVSRSALREEVTYGLGALRSLWLSHDPQPSDILRLPPPVQQRLSQRIADAERDAGEVLRMNKVVLEDLANALNKTRLVEGAVLQIFLDRVVAWHGNDSDPAKTDVGQI